MENYVPIDGIKLWTDIRGNASKHIILCAGGPGCCDYLIPVSQMIEDGYTVIRFEQRGCGRSGKDGNYDMFTVIRDMEAIRAYYGISSWIVGGHSWGANLSLAYAMHYPDKTKAIIYIAGTGVQNDREWSAQYQANRDKCGEVLPKMLFEGNDEVNRKCIKSWREFIQTPLLYKNISELDIHSLIMCAQRDIRPNWPAMQIHALMPNVEYALIDGAAHYIWLTHPDEMSKRLRSFLELPLLFSDGNLSKKHSPPKGFQR